MEILVYDTSPESAKIWSDLAHSHHLPVEINATWPRLEQVSHTAILIIDQSVFPSSFSASLALIAAQRPHQVIVATGSDLSVKQVSDAMRSGVSFMFEKPLNPLQLQNAMLEIVGAARRLFEERSEYERLLQLFDKLTSRETDVLNYVLQGVPNKTTAEELSVSVRTIEARRAKVYDKTQSTCVVELVRKVDRLASLAKIFEVQEIPSREPQRSHESPVKKQLAPRFNSKGHDNGSRDGSGWGRVGVANSQPLHLSSQRTALSIALQASQK